MRFEDKLEQRLAHEDGCISESRPTHNIDVLNQIASCGAFERTVSMWTIADGATGIFRTPDGQAYEVIVRAAKDAQFKGLHGDKLTNPEKERREIITRKELQRRAKP